MKFKEIEKVLREFGFTNIKQVHNNTQVTADECPDCDGRRKI